MMCTFINILRGFLFIFQCLATICFVSVSLLHPSTIVIYSSHYFCVFSQLGAGASVFRLQNQNTVEPEDVVHESNDPEPPHRKIRTWKPNKDVQKQKENGYNVKLKRNTNVGTVTESTTSKIEGIEGPGIIHQHMLSRPFRTPTRSSASQDKECEQSTVGPTKEDNMGIIHQDMLRKPNQ